MAILTEDRFREILKKLLEKSRENLVTWQAGTTSNSYEVAFSDESGATIHILYVSPNAEPDWVVASFDLGGRTVLNLTAEDEDRDFDFLKSLFTEADRIVVGWDRALDRIEKELNSDQRVGIQTKLPTDQVPF